MKTKYIPLASLIFALLLSGCMTTKIGEWKAGVIAEIEGGSILVDTARGPVEYGEQGQGPDLLLLHGSMSGYDNALVTAEMIGEVGFRIIAPSRPGYLGTPIETGRTPEEQADAMAAFLDELGIESLIVAGGSGGGPAAMQLAIRHPERCDALILISSIFEAGLDHRDFNTLQRLRFERLFTDRYAYKAVRQIEKRPEKIFSMMFPHSAKAVAGDAERLELAARFMITNFPMGPRRDGTYNDLQKSNAIPMELLKEISVPTLILHGRSDDWTPLDKAEKAANLIPGAELAVFEGDHLFFFVESDETRQRMIDFAEKHGLY